MRLSTAFPHLRIECASDGMEALMLIGVLRPRLVITDITMPRMDGWEMIELVRRNPLLHHIKICIATALDRASSEEAIHRFRVDAFLELPLSLTELTAEVGRLLNNEPSPSSLTD